MSLRVSAQVQALLHAVETLRQCIAEPLLLKNNRIHLLNLWSLTHGAGRKWNRGSCRARLKSMTHAKALSQTALARVVLCDDRELLLEEAPQAYKSIDAVISDMQRERLIRVTHIPTGLCAVSQQERSQWLNKKLARARLRELLRKKDRRSRRDFDRRRWRQHDAIERGKALRVFRGAISDRCHSTTMKGSIMRRHPAVSESITEPQSGYLFRYMQFVVGLIP